MKFVRLFDGVDRLCACKLAAEADLVGARLDGLAVGKTDPSRSKGSQRLLVLKKAGQFIGQCADPGPARKAASFLLSTA